MATIGGGGLICERVVVRVDPAAPERRFGHDACGRYGEGGEEERAAAHRDGSRE